MVNHINQAGYTADLSQDAPEPSTMENRLTTLWYSYNEANNAIQSISYQAEFTAKKPVDLAEPRWRYS